LPIERFSYFLSEEKVTDGHVVVHENQNFVATGPLVEYTIIASRQPLLVILEKKKAIGAKFIQRAVEVRLLFAAPGA